MSQLADILHLVYEERVRQDIKWGGVSHDDAHTYEEWRHLIFNHNERDGSDDLTRRRLFIEVAALAVAAAQSYDRKDPESRFFVERKS